MHVWTVAWRVCLCVWLAMAAHSAKYMCIWRKPFQWEIPFNSCQRCWLTKWNSGGISFYTFQCICVSICTFNDVRVQAIVFTWVCMYVCLGSDIYPLKSTTRSSYECVPVRAFSVSGWIAIVNNIVCYMENDTRVRREIDKIGWGVQKHKNVYTKFRRGCFLNHLWLLRFMLQLIGKCSAFLCFWFSASMRFVFYYVLKCMLEKGNNSNEKCSEQYEFWFILFHPWVLFLIFHFIILTLDLINKKKWFVGYFFLTLFSRILWSVSFRRCNFRCNFSTSLWYCVRSCCSCDSFWRRSCSILCKSCHEIVFAAASTFRFQVMELRKRLFIISRDCCKRIHFCRNFSTFFSCTLKMTLVFIENFFEINKIIKLQLPEFFILRVNGRFLFGYFQLQALLFDFNFLIGFFERTYLVRQLCLFGVMLRFCLFE